MTDKQIIIDGIDVSGCEYCGYDNVCRLKSASNYIVDCKDNSNCYYKQLKRKEQEYEELRQYHNKCCEDNAKKLEEWLEKFNQFSRDFYNGEYCNRKHCSLLKAKEQECEELKEQLERADEDIKMKCTRCAMTNQLDEQLDQLKVRCKSLEDISGRLQKQNHELTLENEKLEQYKASKQASYEALQKKCNELELEKRKLKERIDQWISKCEQETKLKEFHKNEIDEYKNTLLYIKEIAYELTNEEYTDFIEEKQKQILNKISEVIKDE